MSPERDSATGPKMHVRVDNRPETRHKGGAHMASRGHEDDTTPGLRLPVAESDEKPTLIAASPSQSMLLVADPDDEADSGPTLPHPADDEPGTLLTQAPESRPMLHAAAPAPESRPRIPTPRMDLRMYTPASMGPQPAAAPSSASSINTQSSSTAPSAYTLAPPAPSALSRTPLPFPRFEEHLDTPGPREPRLHPAAWLAVGVLLGAAAMAALLLSRGTREAASNATPSSATVPAETDLEKVAPMPSATPSKQRR